MKLIADITYSSLDGNDLKLDIYLPENNKFKTLIFFHGGGLESGSKEDDITTFKDLAGMGYAIVSVEYRMYPKAKYPEFIEDAAQAVAWVLNNIGRYGVSEKIYIAGSSAGAYIALMLCFDNRYLKKHEINSDDFSGYIFDAGQMTAHFNVLKERGLDTRQIIVDEAAPIYYIKHNPNYTNMTFIVSDNDIKNRLEETNLMVTALKTFGNDESKLNLVIVKDSKHCSYCKMVDDNGKSIFAKMLSNELK